MRLDRLRVGPIIHDVFEGLSILRAVRRTSVRSFSRVEERQVRTPAQIARTAISQFIDIPDSLHAGRR
jgi:hypothetical protein